jgi:hypothetical protein
MKADVTADQSGDSTKIGIDLKTENRAANATGKNSPTLMIFNMFKKGKTFTSKYGSC